MKKVELSNILRKFTFRGFLLGFIVALLVFLFNLNSNVFIQSNRTFADMLILFPGMWIIIALPFITTAVGYYFALRFIKIIRKQRKSLKFESRRSERVLRFVNNLREGNLNNTELVTDKRDQLSKSLLKLHDYLVKSKKEQEQNRIEEEQRTWVTQGLAQFGEILRRNNDNLEELAFNIISYQVNYLKINQGGFYLLNKNAKGDKFFELTSCIAFDRKKFADKVIQWEEGLIGRCALEKDTIYLTDVPNDYITITSGLGETNPSAILIVPLKANDEVYGVIELASFREFQPFEIEFVEKNCRKYCFNNFCSTN